ncbi:MAG TPA: tetratricopeptide repeat protein [Steroidobacteraceae bacterium]|nr:tetratricopeptide repeat protein [Steroidobacteraceae bacterium]
MMRGPARLMALLAVAAATQVAAAADRFVPSDPDFVVATVRTAQPDEKLLPLLAAWRADRAAAPTTVELAVAFIERAQTLREPMYFGRAEAVLAPLASKPGASATLRRLYAQVLQYRHEFAVAESLLDAVLREAPHDEDARLLRASVRLVRGDFSGARADCAQLVAAGGDGAMPGFACYAEALAGGGHLDRALALLDTVSGDRGSNETSARAYLLATRAELRERGDDLAGSIVDYREALRLAPDDDSIRAALADALASHGQPDEARKLLVIDKPSLALLVRSAALAEGPRRTELAGRARSWLALETARGDALHYREAAMLALINADPARALADARRNFEAQKELADVRVLARAARAARDAATLAALRQWLRETGYRDSVTEGILGASLRS